VNVTTRRRSACFIGWVPLVVPPSALADEGHAEAGLDSDDIDRRSEPGLTLILTVSNVTNEDPPRVNFNAAANTDPATCPLLGRTYLVSVRYQVE